MEKYIPTINKLIVKLVQKVTNKNTPTNCRFTYYNKFDVIIQSGTQGYIVVYVNDINTNEEIAIFTIDFWSKELTINSTSGNVTDFSIADSIISSFKELYPDYMPIDDKSVWEEDYENYQDVIEHKEKYIEEYVKEAEDFINLVNKRNEWGNE